jgi:hypothetical protein
VRCKCGLEQIQKAAPMQREVVFFLHRELTAYSPAPGRAVLDIAFSDVIDQICLP